ncbi:MAG: hypothetical protein IJJ26_12730, partial [Victivallales bacterium]|nr:hypothetical protein [Victivallales bacterium]
MLKHILRYSSIFLTATFLAAQAQETSEPVAPQAPSWKPVVLQGGRVVNIGDYSVENLVLPNKLGISPINKDNRSTLWNTFMHGIADSHSTIVPWQVLDGAQKAVLVDDAIHSSLKNSTLPAIKLEGGKRLVLIKPILSPLELYSMRGDTIRLFVWLKAQDAGRDTDLWSGAPRLTATINDGNGNTAAVFESPFKTRGSFPWHCYYMEIKVPMTLAAPAAKPAQTTETPLVTAEVPAEGENTAQPVEGEAPAANAEDEAGLADLASSFVGKENTPVVETVPEEGGLFLTLENPFSGTVWFSTLSWQRISDADSFDNLEKRQNFLDPTLGTFAPNPQFDELPMHLFFDLPKSTPWKFLKGNRVMEDITTINGLDTYFNSALNDWFHLVHAVPFLASVYNNGT